MATAHPPGAAAEDAPAAKAARRDRRLNRPSPAVEAFQRRAVTELPPATPRAAERPARSFVRKTCRPEVGASLHRVAEGLEEVAASLKELRAGQQRFLEDRHAQAAAAREPREPGGEVEVPAAAAPPPTGARAAGEGSARRQSSDEQGCSETKDAASLEAATGKMRDGSKRVKAKVAFYRNRDDLVLPRVEAGFMRKHENTGVAIVDVKKILQRQRRPELDPGTPSSSPRGAPSQTSDAAAAPLAPPKASAEASAEAMPVEYQHLSLLELRKLRVHRAREADLRRRYDVRRSLDLKFFRKELNDQARQLITWVMVAFSASAFGQVHRDAQKFKEICVTVTGEEDRLLRQRISAAATWSAIMADCRKSFRERPGGLSGGPTRPPWRPRLEAIAHRHWAGQESARSARNRVRYWGLLTAVTLLVLALRRRRRRDKGAEVVKHFIAASATHFQTRMRIRRYFQKVRLLQRVWLVSSKIHKLIKANIYLPAVWEVETSVLARGQGIHEALIQIEIEEHRSRGNLEQVMQDVRQLFELRDKLMTKLSAQVWHRCFFALQRKVRLGWLRQEDKQEKMQLPVQLSRETIFRKAGPLDARIGGLRLGLLRCEGVAGEAYRRAVDAWWVFHKGRRERVEASARSWCAWRRQCAALGPARREEWPAAPPRFASESDFLKVDFAGIEGLVVAALERASGEKAEEDCDA